METQKIRWKLGKTWIYTINLSRYIKNTIINFYITSIIWWIIYSYLLFAEGRRVSGVPLNYFIPGHVYTTPI